MPNEIGSSTSSQTTPCPNLAGLPEIRAALAPHTPRLCEVQAEFNRVVGVLRQHTHEEVKAENRLARRKLRDDPSRLTRESMDKLGADFAARSEEVSAKRALIKESLSTYTRSTVIPACLPALRDAITAAAKQLAALEHAERDLHKPFGAEWTPSALHTAAAARLADWRHRLARIESGGIVGYAPVPSLLRGLVAECDLAEVATHKPKR